MRLCLVDDRPPQLSRDQADELISMLAQFLWEAAKGKSEDKGYENGFQD